MHPGLQVAERRVVLTALYLQPSTLSQRWHDLSSSGGDAGLPLLLKQLPSLQDAGYILHSRWFSNETDYAKQNGGRFSFAVENDSAAFPGNGEACCNLAFSHPVFTSHIVV
jgi:hypothetical protein